MTNRKSYWLILSISILLLSLLANQMLYVYNAATEQEAHFNDKANMALASIVEEVSKNHKVCNSVNACIKGGQIGFCSLSFKSKDEWHFVNSIVQQNLKESHIDLPYNFDFCSNDSQNSQLPNNSDTYSKTLDHGVQQSGLIMYLEFPSKSSYILKQMGATFMSSLFIIVLITIIFILIYRFYIREKRNAERTKDFLNTMTHEFKTPLANIAFANNMLARQATQAHPETIQKYTAIIRAENDKMVKHSEDILEMARQEYDLTKVEDETIDVHQLIIDLKNTFIASNPNLLLQLHLNAERPLVNGNRSFLSNAVSNIIDNAIKYSNQVPEIRISTANHSNNNSLHISIEDKGIGIDKSQQTIIFDKFYRVSTGDQHDVKGFGLGLAYVKQIIEHMKGSISLKSHLGQGSVFTIKLPISNVS